jgi:tol-pal system protein YbgF
MAQCKKMDDMMKKALLLTLLSAVALSAAGCATRRQVIDLQMEVEAVRADQAEIKAQNAGLDSLFRSSIEEARRNNAEFAQYIDQLEERMQIVQARLEDAVTLINRAAGAMEGSAPRRPLPGDTLGAETSRGVEGGLDCQKLYNAAYADFVKERFDMAVKGFNSYIDNCPNTALADNAQYWIGESYLSQKQYPKAQVAFEKMLQLYPSSERIAAGKLKLGRSLYEQRQRTNARKYFEDVVKNYPGTNEAQEAADMLERYR